MKELKILLVLIVFTGVIYWGVEPLAHSIFHPHTEPADYSFGDLDGGAMAVQGDVAQGEELVKGNCTACHGIKAVDVPAAMDSESAAAAFGVAPPDLSTLGGILDAKYLTNFIKNPTVASKLTAAFDDAGKPFPMPGYQDSMSDQDIASMVAYLQSIAPAQISNEEVFVDACARCHSLEYAGIEAQTEDDVIEAYMASLPPDLSIMIRAKNEEYLHKFINDPQKLLPGTTMPRVGLTEQAEKQIVTLLEETGDRKKAEREALAPWILGFLLLLTIFSYLWKIRIWRDVH